MELTKLVASALVVGSLGFGVATVQGPVASALPSAPVPMKPGNGNGDGNGNGNGNGCQPWCDGPKHNEGNGDWDKGPWWANNPHDWWDDRNGAPPWGWGPPPPLHWNGQPLPASINYWGYNANPVWHDGFRQWGIWLFGQWIPIFGVGFN
jgi:hypothetical protein